MVGTGALDEFDDFERFGDLPVFRATPTGPVPARPALRALAGAIAHLEAHATAAGDVPAAATVDPPLSEGEALALTELATRLARLAAGVDLAGGESSVVRRLPVAVESLRRATDALGARALTAADADQSWRADGQRSFTSWLAATTGIHRGRAGREIRRAHALRDDLPTFRALLARGELGADHVDAVVREAMASQDRLAALRDPDYGEHALAGAAADATASEFTRTVRLWAYRMDPHAADRKWRELLATEQCTLAQTLDGYHLQGFLTPEHGQMLRLALDAQTGQGRASDERTRAQRDAHALTTLAKQALASGTLQRGARVRPHLIALVPLDTWTTTATAAALAGRTATTAALLATTTDDSTGEDLPEAVLTAALDPDLLRGLVPATFEDGTPMSPSQLALHMCDAAVTRVVLDAASEVIDVGREERLFTEAQAKGILARDRHCQYPGCDARPNWCQYHHTIWWSRNGESNIAEGILLCWAHHQHVHALGLSILRYPDRWEYRTPDGHLHATRQRHHPTLPRRRT